MKNKIPFLTLQLMATVLFSSGIAQEKITSHTDGDVSLKLEIQRSIDKGIEFLKSQQDRLLHKVDLQNCPLLQVSADSAPSMAMLAQYQQTPAEKPRVKPKSIPFGWI